MLSTTWGLHCSKLQEVVTEPRTPAGSRRSPQEILDPAWQGSSLLGQRECINCCKWFQKWQSWPSQSLPPQRKPYTPQVDCFSPGDNGSSQTAKVGHNIQMHDPAGAYRPPAFDRHGLLPNSAAQICCMEEETLGTAVRSVHSFPRQGTQVERSSPCPTARAH